MTLILAHKILSMIRVGETYNYRKSRVNPVLNRYGPTGGVHAGGRLGTNPRLCYEVRWGTVPMGYTGWV